LRAQLLLGKAQLRNAARSGGLIAVALVFLIAAIAVLDLSVYAALSEIFGPLQAGGMVCVGNLVLAGVLMLLAGREAKETEQTRLAEELSEVALDALGKDIDLARNELREFSRDVRRIRHTAHLVTSAFGAPLGLLLKFLSEGLSDEDDKQESGGEA
jgi:hypothetical protein